MNSEMQLSQMTKISGYPGEILEVERRGCLCIFHQVTEFEFPILNIFSTIPNDDDFRIFIHAIFLDGLHLIFFHQGDAWGC